MDDDAIESVASDDEIMIHAAGPVMHYNTTLRQRCMWCGKALIDQDLGRTSVQLSPSDVCEICHKSREEHESPDIIVAAHKRHAFSYLPPTYPTWQPGAFIAHGGGISYVVLDAGAAADVRMSDLAAEHKIPVCLLLPTEWTS